ncbi:MAG: flagellar hook assembly protein FlgD [Deltaproteobacteria bacterium]|nr:flagellar hook assembly protein FlgD [Deltaproteobacteria bacterium]
MSSTTISDIINVVSKDSTTTKSSTATQTLGKEDFMQLLIAQLKNQDPLDPMENTDFVAQLAQFSTLEQLTNMNTEIQTQGVNQMTLGYAQSVSMIGKEVIAQSGDAVTVSGDTATLNYELTDDAQTVYISIYDRNGNLVDSIEESNKTPGMNKTTWDCSNMEKGDYTFQVSAADASGNSVTASTRMSGTVTAVHFKNNSITLTVNGQELALNDIVSVEQQNDK